MFVNTEWLHSGASQTHRAAGYAHDGADQLSRAPLSSGMFGDFAAADTYHEAISTTHSRHVKTFRAHHETLASLGNKVRAAAAAFTEMDELNATKLRAGQCKDSDT
jgi:Protein of unknown function (DUF2563)